MPKPAVRPRRSKRNRIAPILKNLKGIEDPDDLMLEILNVLTETDKIPRAGKFYVFVYNAKTPYLRYDQNPLVAVTNVYNWGFSAFNYHWGKSRQYTWDEVAGGLYEVYQEEVADLRRIPFGNIRLNS